MATISVNKRDMPLTKEVAGEVVTSGQAVAALISSGIGTLFIGLMTTGAEASAGLKEFLKWSDPVGPLSGKIGVSLIVWLISWIVMHQLFKDKESNLARAFTITLILIALGIVFTFPPVFEAFAAE
jgi:hypothetical protein